MAFSDGLPSYLLVDSMYDPPHIHSSEAGDAASINFLSRSRRAAHNISRIGSAGRLLVYDRRSVQPMYRRLMFLACRRSYRSRDGPFRGFFCSAQLANGPTTHPPTIAPPPESGAWTCVWRYYYGF
ncbi:hypothetical protein DY000_02049578 [Brassica cretica]|uniref:Uncharacterized protein n=1 Tax=Brassica cretica TaxID=69181 RepID=A0ABQ7F5S3_BRACR|nr:hypothetical protein DY000_02049578 [Brassica cretica]